MRGVVLLLAILAAAVPLGATPARYTLYYLDETHHVARLSLDRHGQPVGRARQLTPALPVDGFAISPDEQTVIGFKAGQPVVDKVLGTRLAARLVTCRAGHLTTWPEGTLKPVRALSQLRACWKEGGRQAAIWDDGAHGGLLCRLSWEGTAKVVREYQTSPDKRYYTDGWFLESHYGTKLVDRQTGQETGLSSYEALLVWLGASGKAAWSNGGGVWVGAPRYHGGRLEMDANAPLLGYEASALWYEPWRGLFILANGGRLYRSKDLRTCTELGRFHLPDLPATEALAKRGITAAEAEYSPGRAFIVYTHSLGGPQPEIRVIGPDGDPRVLARGTAPHWRVPAGSWEPNGPSDRVRIWRLPPPT